MARLTALLLFVLGGCTSLPTSEQIRAADYGPYPENFEQVVKDFYNVSLKDPGSAQYRSISRPMKMYLGSRLGQNNFGWLTCVTLNAKNSFGGYTGYSTDGVLIKNGAVIQHVPKGNWWGKQVC